MAAGFLFEELCRQRGQPELVLFLLIFDVKGLPVVGYHAAVFDAWHRLFSRHASKVSDRLGQSSLTTANYLFNDPAYPIKDRVPKDLPILADIRRLPLTARRQNTVPHA